MALPNKGQLNLNESPLWGSRSVDCYEKLEQIGEGTYGQVYKARELKTGEIVALKKIRMEKEMEGFPLTAIREIKILKKLHHENVIKLKEIVTSPGPEKDDHGKPDGNKYKCDIYLVFEYMDHDLTGLTDRPGVRLSVPQIKCYMKQLLTGLHYCHINQVLHRDIKASNLLINNEGTLKLADFGLARSFARSDKTILTNRVITLWYRPPELLLGSTKYGPAVDMWSVGCIFAELLHAKKPILQGKDEPEQLEKIFELCGVPDETNWPGVSKLPFYDIIKSISPMKRRIREVFIHLDHHALELLEKMLTLDPAQRISAKEALDADYFWTDPLPCDPKSLPKYEPSHEFQIKKQRKQQQEQEATKKQQKLQRRHQLAQHPPIQQPQQAYAPMQPLPYQFPLGAGPSQHHFGNLCMPPRGGPGWYPNHPYLGGAGYGRWQHAVERRGAAYGWITFGPQGSSGGGGYVVGTPNYRPQNGPNGGGSSSGGCGSNAEGGNRNQQ